MNKFVNKLNQSLVPAYKKTPNQSLRNLQPYSDNDVFTNEEKIINRQQHSENS